LIIEQDALSTNEDARKPKIANTVKEEIMSEAPKRSPILMIPTGAQDIGKSYQTLRAAIYQAYVATHKRKTLIFDTNNEYAQYEIEGKMHFIKAINHTDIIKYGNSNMAEVRRIVPFKPNGMPMSPEEAEKLLVRVIEEFRGGTLVIEDLNRLYGDSLPVSISGLLCNVRHRNCDVVFHLQSVARILPKMLQNSKVIRFHYQLDTISNSAEKLRGEDEIYRISEKLVTKEYDKGGTNVRFFVFIYRMERKLKGAFSNKMLAEAIMEYISENQRILKPLLEKRTPTGSKMYNYQQSLNIKTIELYKRYQGNV